MFRNFSCPSYIPPPLPRKNGGLYTGESAPQDAPHANVPIMPSTEYMISEALKSANPPPGATKQIPKTTRIGNSCVGPAPNDIYLAYKFPYKYQ